MEDMARSAPPAAALPHPGTTKQAIEDVQVVLGKHDLQLENMSRDIVDLRSLNESTNAKIDNLGVAINNLTLTASRSPFDVVKILQASVYATALVSAFVACIVYITSNHFAADWATQRADNLQLRLNVAELKDQVKELKARTP